MRTLITAVLLVALALAGGLTPALIQAQRSQSPLEIEGLSHARVEDRDIIIVLLSNSGDESIQALGELALRDPEGVEIANIEVTTGVVLPGTSSVLAVPINVPLEPGPYTVTLYLEDSLRRVRTDSGLREIVIYPSDSPPIEETPVAVAPLDDAGGESSGGGFPSWLLLIIGLSITVVGVTFMRGIGSSSGRSAPRPVPEVSMVRKVKVTTPAARRPATIKPLTPPARDRAGEKSQPQ